MAITKQIWYIGKYKVKNKNRAYDKYDSFI